MTTYTIAYVSDCLLAVVPDGDDITEAVRTVEEHTGEEVNTYVTAPGCTLTNDPEPNDTIVFASPSGSCGWLMARENDADVTYDYAVLR